MAQGVQGRTGQAALKTLTCLVAEGCCISELILSMHDVCSRGRVLKEVSISEEASPHYSSTVGKHIPTEDRPQVLFHAQGILTVKRPSQKPYTSVTVILVSNKGE